MAPVVQPRWGCHFTYIAFMPRVSPAANQIESLRDCIFAHFDLKQHGILPVLGANYPNNTWFALTKGANYPNHTRFTLTKGANYSNRVQFRLTKGANCLNQLRFATTKGAKCLNRVRFAFS